jgi:hypothetical protein
VYITTETGTAVGDRTDDMTFTENSGYEDDAVWQVPLPFTFIAASTNFGNGNNGGVWLSSNNMIMFGAGSTGFSSFSASNPAYPTLFHGAGDWQLNYLLYVDEVASHSRIRVRAECKDSYTSGEGSPFVYEVSFYVDGRLEIAYDSQLPANVVEGATGFSNGQGYWYLTSFTIGPSSRLTFHNLAYVA